jgi:hypothetical protein
MAITAEECLTYEAECLEMADDSKMASQRERLLTLAKLWRELAREKSPSLLMH